MDSRDFYDAYDRLAQDGYCDEPGGEEYKRVLGEWFHAGKPAGLKTFIVNRVLPTCECCGLVPASMLLNRRVLAALDEANCVIGVDADTDREVTFFHRPGPNVVTFTMHLSGEGEELTLDEEAMLWLLGEVKGEAFDDYVNAV
jgi:hypothetical protein